jgi:hypothetical protein
MIHEQNDTVGVENFETDVTCSPVSRRDPGVAMRAARRSTAGGVHPGRLTLMVAGWCEVASMNLAGGNTAARAAERKA